MQEEHTCSKLTSQYRISRPIFFIHPVVLPLYFGWFALRLNVRLYLESFVCISCTLLQKKWSCLKRLSTCICMCNRELDWLAQNLVTFVRFCSDSRQCRVAMHTQCCYSIIHSVLDNFVRLLDKRLLRGLFMKMGQFHIFDFFLQSICTRPNFS